MFSARINSKQLASFSRRLATSLDAGVDARTTFGREAERAVGMRAKSRMRVVREAIDQGHSIAEALDATDDYFPEMYRELVRVGEETGRLGETLTLLAEHYEGQVRLSRGFLVMLVWPMLELSLAVAVIGLVIWLQGVIGQITGTRVDIIGLGLIGNTGLAIYVLFVATIALVVFLLIRALRRGAFWTQPLQRLALRVPGLGRALRTISLARLTWGMHLTFNTGMDVRRAVQLALKSTNNAHFIGQIGPIQRAIAAGDSLFEAFDGTEAFPVDFLDALHVAEQSGSVAESMAHLSKQYRQQAEAAMTVLATLGAFAVGLLIALILIVMIFTIFQRAYLDPIRELTR